MVTQFTIPEGYHASFRRLLPYKDAPLHNDLQVPESLLIFFMLGENKWRASPLMPLIQTSDCLMPRCKSS
jgi:hypothetical protein